LIQQGVFLKPDPKREKRTKTPKIHKLKAVSLIPKKKKEKKKKSLILKKRKANKQKTVNYEPDSKGKRKKKAWSYFHQN